MKKREAERATVARVSMRMIKDKVKVPAMDGFRDGLYWIRLKETAVRFDCGWSNALHSTRSNPIHCAIRPRCPFDARCRRNLAFSQSTQGALEFRRHLKSKHKERAARWRERECSRQLLLRCTKAKAKQSQCSANDEKRTESGQPRRHSWIQATERERSKRSTLGQREEKGGFRRWSGR